MHLLIITPIFPPIPGGAATYYELLSSGLISRGIVDKVTVVTEYCEGRDVEQYARNNIDLISLFPYRAGGSKNKIVQYFLYAVQNALYFLIPYLVYKKRPDIILIHSSFHNFINLTISPVVKYVSSKVPVISDVRDHQMPENMLKYLRPYQAVIACSLNVLNHVKRSKTLANRLIHIPIIQERINLAESGVMDTLQEFNLTKSRYLLYAGLIKSGKGIKLLIETYQELRQRGVAYDLVVVGQCKDHDLLTSLSSIPGVHYLGPVQREKLLHLVSCSAISLNLSGSEGMPRTSLEALAIGVKVLLPQGIPEFEDCCADAVMCSKDPLYIASQIETILSNESVYHYPVENHDPDSVLRQYEELFKRVVDDFKH